MNNLISYIKNYTKEHNIDYDKFINTLCKKNITTVKRRAEIVGMRRGERKGIYKNKVAIAKKLLAKNYEITVIRDITGLSLNIIKYLQKMNEN